MALVQYGMLGPLAVRAGGSACRLGGLRRRAVLGHLLVHRNTVVPIPGLIDAVWGDEPPRTARQAVHNAIAALRRALGPAVEQLRTEESGYRLVVEPDQVDVDRFRALLARGRAVVAEDPGSASTALRGALALWRGPPLADLADAGLGWATRPDLDEERLAAHELCIRAELALGRHADLVGELRELVDQHPTRERLVAQLMVALYRSGRQADALDAFARARSRTVQELGVEPGDELQRLHVDMLTRTAPENPTARQPNARTADDVEESTSRRRVVSVVVARVHDWRTDQPVDPEHLEVMTESRVEVVRREVERRGGVVGPVLGPTVLAVLGSTVAHEDDPQRAVEAAMALVADPAMGRGASAVVVAGPVAIALGAGGVLERVAGRAVSTATALLERAEPSQVLTTPATATALHPAVRTRALPGGASRGPPAVRVLDVPPSLAARVDGGGQPRPPTPSPALVGRRAELETLLAALHGSRTSPSPRMVVVLGPSGIGKTRLAIEARARDSGATWLVGRTRRDGAADTFGVLAQVVEQALDDVLGSGSGGLAARAAGAAATLGLVGAPAASVVAAVRTVLGDGSPEEAAGPADVVGPVADLLRALARRRPVVVLLDDLHAASPSVLDTVHRFAQALADAAVSVLVTGDGELLERRPDWAPDGDATVGIVLDPLLDGDVVALLRAEHGSAATDGAPVDPTTLERIGGNPLFALEYARTLVERARDEALAARHPRSRRPAAVGGAVEAPTSVQTLVSARLDRLPPSARTVVQDAALCGTVVTADMVAAVGERDDTDAVARCLHHLARLHLLRAIPGVPAETAPRWAFAHGVVAEVAYERLPLTARRDRHDRAAAFLAAAPRVVVDRPDRVAHHLQRALDAADALGEPSADLRARAGEALRAAADRAARHGAHATARRWYGAALTHGRDAPDRPELLLGLASSTWLLDGTGEELLVEARAALLAAGRDHLAARAEIMLASAAWRRGEDDRPFHVRAAALVADDASSPAAAFVLSRMALRRAIDQDTEQALGLGRRALAVAEGLDLPDDVAKARMAIGMARVEAGDEGGLVDLEVAVTTLVRRDLPLAANALINLAPMRALLGDLAGCFAAQHRAHAVATRHQLAAELRWLEAERAVERYWRGHGDGADALRRFVRSAGREGGHYLEWLCRVLLARIELDRGRVGRAAGIAESVLPRARELHDPQVLAPALALQARVLAVVGDRAGAATVADELLELLAGRLLLPEVGIDLAVALRRTGSGAARLDAAGLGESVWLSATRALVRGDRATAARRYAAIGSVADARASAGHVDAGGR